MSNSDQPEIPPSPAMVAIAEREAMWAARVAARSPVNRQLAEIGYPVDFEVFRHAETPPNVLAILFDAIVDGKMPPLEIGLAAECFAHPAANDYWERFIELYRSRIGHQDPDVIGDGLADALGLMCNTADQLAEVYELIEDSRYGESRVALMRKVRRMDSPVFQELFERMVEHDEQLRTEILSWKSYWKKRNPDLLEKWKGWKRLKRARI